jgi:hypothetical protein
MTADEAASVRQCGGVVMETNRVDIKENAIHSLDPKILKFLLRDKTTGKNIIWATEDYASFGDGYAFSDEITIPLITGENGMVIRPRIEKTRAEQTSRSRGKAEVFTPSWVCNEQNNLVDSAWFGQKNVFNTETEKGWITNSENVVFPGTKGRTWQDYVKANRLEISCGEAPYLTSRYDTVTGASIPVKDRIGLLDRKLRVVSENTEAEQDWVFWATKAVQSIYGYDWQGDNVLLARENILFTFAEHYEDRFGVPATKAYLEKIAKVAAWNIFQMDGIKFVVPGSCHLEAERPEMEGQGEIAGVLETKFKPCPGCAKSDHSKHNGVYSRTYDWPSNESVEFYSFIKKGEKRNGSKV